MNFDSKPADKKGGFDSILWQRKYREKNKEKIKKYQKDYREKHKEELKRKHDERYQKNKDQINKRRKEKYKKNHKEKLAKIQEYVDKNRINYWALNTISDHRKKKCIINFSRDDLKLLAEKTSNCFYCNIKLNFNRKQGKGPRDNSPTVDRINNQKKLDINRIRIICYKCNKSKSNRTHKEFISYCDMISKKFNRR